MNKKRKKILALLNSIPNKKIRLSKKKISDITKQIVRRVGELTEC